MGGEGGRSGNGELGKRGGEEGGTLVANAHMLVVQWLVGNPRFPCRVVVEDQSLRWFEYVS